MTRTEKAARYDRMLKTLKDHASEGGLVSAARLSPEQRRARAVKAVRAREARRVAAKVR